MWDHHIGSYVAFVQYEIRVTGHLDSRWAAVFDGLTVTREDGGTTVIHGPIVDQAALTQVLSERRIAGAGLDVLEVEPPERLNLLADWPVFNGPVKELPPTSAQ